MLVIAEVSQDRSTTRVDEKTETHSKSNEEIRFHVRCWISVTIVDSGDPVQSVQEFNVSLVVVGFPYDDPLPMA